MGERQNLETLDKIYKSNKNSSIESFTNKVYQVKEKISRMKDKMKELE